MITSVVDKMAESQQLYEFKKALKRLAGFHGTGTELISVYIPSGSPLHDTANRLREEMSQASNIKSKSTRTNVISALERILQHFKIYKNTPENGIAVFAGNVSDNPSKTDIELFAIGPPQKLAIGTYRCDSKFFLEPLQKMIDNTDTYGIVVLDGREATLALVRGTQTDIVKRMNSTAHQKVNKGGQSQRRYQRLIEESIELYYKRIGDAIDEHFLNKVKGVIVGGPGPAKEGFMKANTQNYQIKIMGVVDTGYTDEIGIREVLNKSGELIQEQESIKEKSLVDRFIKEVVNDGLATYGEKQVRTAIENNQAEKVLISEGLEYKKATYVCNSCNSKIDKLTKERISEKIPCKCGSEMKLEKQIDLLEELVELAREHSIEVEIISTNTSEGLQLLNGFTGIGAFLRYKTR